LISNGQVPETPSRTHLVRGAVRYLAGKALTIAAAIFLAVFITVLITNQPSQRGLGPPALSFADKIVGAEHAKRVVHAAS
jgi:hypothetical protein